LPGRGAGRTPGLAAARGGAPGPVVLGGAGCQRSRRDRGRCPLRTVGRRRAPSRRVPAVGGRAPDGLARRATAGPGGRLEGTAGPGGRLEGTAGPGGRLEGTAGPGRRLEG